MIDQVGLNKLEIITTDNKRKTKMKSLIFIIALTLAFVTFAHARSEFIVKGTVTKTALNTTYESGTCRVFMPEFIDKGKCMNNWLSLNCAKGKDTDYSIAVLMFAVVERAKANKTNITVTVAEHRRPFGNGMCIIEDLVIE